MSRPRLRAISAREASIFACVCDTVVAPEPLLPPVRDTDAALFFDRWMGRAPRPNRAGMRALLLAIELAPLLLGRGARLRRLPEAERALLLAAAEAGPRPVRQLASLVKGMALLAYYGDDGVLRRVGYDPDENLRRARELRVAEGRP